MLGLDRRDGGVEVYTIPTVFSAHLHGCLRACRHLWRFPDWQKQTGCFQVAKIIRRCLYHQKLGISIVVSPAVESRQSRLIIDLNNIVSSLVVRREDTF